MSSTGWSWIAVVEPLAADDAQAGAVRPAERRDRLGQQDRLADRRSRGRARGGRSGGRRRARRRSAAGGRSRGRAPAGTPPAKRMSTGKSDLAQAAAALEVERRRGGRASARMPRLVRTRRTRPAIGSASRRSSPRSIRTSSTSRTRSAPGSSASRPATFQASGASSGPLAVTAAGGRLRRLVPSVGSAAAAVDAPRPRARRAARRASRSPS